LHGSPLARAGEKRWRLSPRGERIAPERPHDGGTPLAAGFGQHLVKPVDPRLLLYELQTPH